MASSRISGSGEYQNAVASAEASLQSLIKLREIEAQHLMTSEGAAGQRELSQRGKAVSTMPASRWSSTRIAQVGAICTQYLADHASPPTSPPLGKRRTDLETVDALIARYAKMQTDADKAASTVRENVSTDIRGVSQASGRKRSSAADAVAKLQARGIDVPQAKLDQLQQQIILAKEAQAEQQRLCCSMPSRPRRPSVD